MGTMQRRVQAKHNELHRSTPTVATCTGQKRSQQTTSKQGVQSSASPIHIHSSHALAQPVALHHGGGHRPHLHRRANFKAKSAQQIQFANCVALHGGGRHRPHLQEERQRHMDAGSGQPEPRQGKHTSGPTDFLSATSGALSAAGRTAQAQGGALPEPTGTEAQNNATAFRTRLEVVGAHEQVGDAGAHHAQDPLVKALGLALHTMHRCGV